MIWSGSVPDEKTAEWHRMVCVLLMRVFLPSLLLRGEAQGAGRGEDGREVETRCRLQVKAVGSYTSNAFCQLLIKGPLPCPWLWYRTVLCSWVLWPPFHWAILFYMLMFPKPLLHRIVWCAGCVNHSPLVATAPADTGLAHGPLLAIII